MKLSEQQNKPMNRFDILRFLTQAVFVIFVVSISLLILSTKAKEVTKKEIQIEAQKTEVADRLTDAASTAKAERDHIASEFQQTKESLQTIQKTLDTIISKDR